MNTEARIARLAEQLPDNVDAALITSNWGIYYFTGLNSGAGTVIVTRKGAFFIIDSRYIEIAKKTVKACEVILQGRVYHQIYEVLSKCGCKTAAVETSYLSLRAYDQYAKAIPSVTFLKDSHVDDIVKGMRAHKDAWEIEQIQAAQAITDATYTHILNFIRPGRTEIEIAAEMEYFMRRQGAERFAFDTICISGPNTSLPHGVPGTREVRRGDFITMDYGAMVGGYCSDMTRTVAVGEASEEMRAVYDIVLSAQKAAIEKAAVGVPCCDVDAAARNLITEAGYGACFGHSTGHSVGLEIHEMPGFGAACHTPCEPGHVITVEPGIYIEGKFGVRIEDMIWIRPDGIVDLTHSDKQFTVV